MNTQHLKLACAGALLGLAPTPRAAADVLFSSDGSDASSYQNSYVNYNGTFLGTGAGCTVENANPFLVNGVSQGSYIAATSYPIAFFDAPATASASGLWLGFLMRPDAPNTWAGGINLFGDTSLPANHQLTQYAGTVGWYANTMSIALRDPNGNSSAGYAIADAQEVAVMVHLYDTGDSGTFNTGDLYVDDNLADGVSLGTPLVSGFALTGAMPTIDALRLAADPVSPETRDYDNIFVTTTEQEMLSGVGTGVASVPEPSTLALVVAAAGQSALLFRRRKGVWL